MIAKRELGKPTRNSLSLEYYHSPSFCVLKVMKARNTLSKPQPPLLVKISPDLSDEELDDISDVAVATGIDGIIISNTTTSRADTLFSGKYTHMRIKLMMLFYRHTHKTNFSVLYFDCIHQCPHQR